MNHVAPELTTAHQRLKAILDTQLKSKGSWAALENAMRDVDCAVERRKLTSIWRGKKADVRLSMIELDNLDRYLLLQSLPGLESVFLPTSLATAIARTGTVGVWLGFKPEWATADQDGQTTASHWDVRSLNFLGDALHQASAKVGVLSKEVLLSEHDGTGENWSKQLQQCEWCRNLEDQSQRHSLITVGSPKACHATEWVLAKMFGVSGFACNAAVTDLPFWFEYSPRLLESHPSAFACSAAGVPNRSTPRSRRFDIYALHFNKERCAGDLNEDEWDEYGVIATQRRASGMFWTVVAGMSGPTTYAAARKLVAIDHEFGNAVDAERNSPVFCRAVKARVQRLDANRPGDNRVVLEMELLPGPIIWPPTQQSAPPPKPRRAKHKAK